MAWYNGTMIKSFEELLDALAELPMVPHDALDQITEVIVKNFPSILDNDDDDEV